MFKGYYRSGPFEVQLIFDEAFRRNFKSLGHSIESFQSKAHFSTFDVLVMPDIKTELLHVFLCETGSPSCSLDVFYDLSRECVIGHAP